MRRPRLRFAIAVALASLALAGCGRDSDDDEETVTSDKVPVVVRAAASGSIRRIVTATGLVKPAPGAELLVTAPQSARIADVRKAVGDPVRKGEILVRFEIPMLGSDTAARRSELARADARLESARSEAERISGLFDRGIAARREHEEARRELADAEASVDEARSALSASESIEDRTLVRALFDGIAVSRWHNPGDMVEAGSGDPILRVIDPARLEVVASVPLNEATGVEVGQLARILGPSDAGANAEGSDPAAAGTDPAAAGTNPTVPVGSGPAVAAGFDHAAPASSNSTSAATAGEEAKVLTGPAAVDPETSSVPIRLAFVRPTRLPAGTPVRVEIFGGEHPVKVLVAAAALVHEGAGTFVYVVDGDGKARRRPVVAGIVSGGKAEVLSGLAPGDAVVVQGQDVLPDGASVTITP